MGIFTNTKKWLLALALSAGLISANAAAQTQVNRVTTKAATTSQWLKSLDVSGSTAVFTATRPAFSDISGSLAGSQLPAFAGGDCTTSAGSVAISCQFLQSGTGAVSRSVVSKIGEVLSVTDFSPAGVDIGDGVTDAGPTIRKAVAACLARSSSGGTLRFPVPTSVYLINTLDTSGAAGILIGDGAAITATVSITSGANILTSATSVFTPSMVGAFVTLPGAGTAGATLTDVRVSSYQSGTQVTLDKNAATTLAAVSKTFQVAHQNTCNLEGVAGNPWGYYEGGVGIKLGNGLNRPLLRVALGAASPTIRNMRLDGNASNQVGWAGGPAGKLFTVQVDDGIPYPEGSLECYNSWFSGGYNGNLYIGSARGHTRLEFCWSQYSGQSSADYSVYFNGYDLFATNLNVGPNYGNGILVSQGSAYQFTGGQIFLNSYDGLVVGGNAVAYLMMQGVNFQANGCNGIKISNVAAPGGSRTGGHQFSNITFDGNSATTNGACADAYIDNFMYATFNSPVFNGASNTSWNRPGWNIATNGTSQVRVSAPVFNSASYVTAWTNAPTQMLCSDCNVTNTFQPSLAGATTAGTPTYTARSGTWTRNNNDITVNFKVGVSALGSPSGYATISGLPFTASSPGSEDGRCTFTDWTGWTAQAGYTDLKGAVINGTSSIYLVENGSTKSLSLTDVSQLAATTVLQGICTYTVAN